MIQKLTLILIPLMFSLLTRAQVAPNTGDVFISEISRFNSANDYLELYNNTSNSITLANCKLVRKFGAGLFVYDFNSEGSGDIIIPANGFLIISDDISKSSFNTVWSIDVDALGANFNQAPASAIHGAYLYILKSGGTADTDDGTVIDSSLARLGSPRRYFQAPIGEYKASVTSTLSDFTPGTFDVIDDLSSWNGIFRDGAWQGETPSSSTGSSSFLVNTFIANITDGAVLNNLYLRSGSAIYNTNQTVTIQNNLTLEESSSFRIGTSGGLSVGNETTVHVTGLSHNNGYNVWSSPFNGSPNILSTFSGANPCDIYAYKASTQEWKHDYSVPFSTSCNGNSVTFTSANVIGSPDGTADGNFDQARGYFAPGDASPERTISSTTNPNNGTISVPIYGTNKVVVGGNDWNLLGNPYISGLSVNSLIQENSSLINAVYVYNGSTGAYETYTNGDGFNLAISQGFFIDGNSTTDGVIGNINFNNSQRIYTFDSFRKTEPEGLGLDTTIIYLSLLHGNLYDQTRIYIDSNCLDGIDNKFDARKLMNDHNLNFASEIEVYSSLGPEAFVFNGVKTLSDQEEKVIDLFVQTDSPGNFEIQIDSVRDLPSGINIQLEDRVLSTMTNLKTESYSFNSSIADTLKNRFFLHLTNTVNSVNDLESALNASIYIANEQINVTVIGNDNLDVVEVYDVTGRIISATPGNSNTMSLSTSSYGNGIYIVKAISESGSIATQRVFIK